MDKDVDEDDIQLLSDFILRNTRCFPVYVQFDSDDDGINDYLETELYNSDIRKKDTDDDGLSDQDEIVRTKTDPTVYDSVNKGFSDAESDLDEDGLSNIKEIQIGSNPRIADSDYDGLDDGYEVNKSKTDPANIDSDGDNITDYEEIELGLDPLNKETDGTPDNKRIITQVITSDDPIFANINTDDNAYSISVEIEASGYARKLLNVSKSGFSYAMKDGSAIGIVPEFTYDDNFEVKSITINFEIKEPFIENVSHYFFNADAEYEITDELDGIKRLNVFKYFNSIDLSMPVYTEYDVSKNIVKVTVDTFEKNDEGKSYGIGSYSLVDLEVWGEMMNNGPETEIADEERTDSQSSNKDTSDIFESARSLITKKVNNISDADLQLIYKNYRADTSIVGEQNNVFALFGHRYALFDASDIDYSDAFDACNARGGHLMTITTPLEYSLLKGPLTSGKSGFFLLGATGSYGAWAWITNEPTDYLETIKFDNFKDDSYGQYFEDFRRTLAYCAGHDCKKSDRSACISASGYICEWEPGDTINYPDTENTTLRMGSGAVVSLNAPLSATSGVDSDGDGTAYWDEIDHNAIKNLGGKTGDTSVLWNTALDYVKKLKVNSKQDNSWDNRIKKQIKTCVGITPTKTSPQDTDSDRDGIPDSKDAMPNEPFDPVFELTKSFETIDINDNIAGKEKKAIDCYGKAAIEDMDAINNIIKRARANIILGRLLGWEHFPDFLEHFMKNKGEDYYYSAKEVVEKTSGAEYYKQHMNEVRALCESTVLDKLTFKTVPSLQYKDSKATIFSTEDLGILFSETNTSLAIDWWLSVGDADAAISLECTKEGNTYTATVRYYILDYYDWNEGAKTPGGLVKDGELFILHNVGKAKEFKSVGVYEKEMTWEKGERLYIDPRIEVCVDEGLRRVRSDQLVRDIRVNPKFCVNEK